MEYTFEYKSQEEKENILFTNNSLILIEEQTITKGNFLIFLDAQTYKLREVQKLNQDRIENISNYACVDNSILDILETAIIEYETNLILGGM